jgi:ribosomal protein S2
VGTKKQARETIEWQASRVGMPYVTERWMGGMLTNFQTIKGRVARLKELEAMESSGTFELLPKKEVLQLNREHEKLQTNLGGIREMAKLPDAIWVVDTVIEEIAVKEANRLKIPVIGILDTNCDPDLVQFPIPGNDDAIRSSALLTRIIADACADGLLLRASRSPDEELRVQAMQAAAVRRRRPRGVRAQGRVGDRARAPAGRRAGHPRRRQHLAAGGDPAAGGRCSGRRGARPRRRRAEDAAPPRLRPTSDDQPAGDTPLTARTGPPRSRSAGPRRPPRIPSCPPEGGPRGVSAADVKKLRELTNAPMMACKKALEDADGDLDKAAELVRERTGAKMDARAADRTASEGLVYSYLHTPTPGMPAEGRRHAPAVLRDRLRRQERAGPGSPATSPSTSPPRSRWWSPRTRSTHPPRQGEGVRPQGGARAGQAREHRRRSSRARSRRSTRTGSC